jgi:hypothetical protein
MKESHPRDKSTSLSAVIHYPVTRLRRVWERVLASVFCRENGWNLNHNSVTNLSMNAERSTLPVTAERSTELRKTPLNALHRKLGARMVNFGGWDMPVEYPANGGLIAEHKAVRNGVGVFDVSHMGDIRIRTGATPGGALAAVQHLSMNDASKLAIGRRITRRCSIRKGRLWTMIAPPGEDDFCS